MCSYTFRFCIQILMGSHVPQEGDDILDLADWNRTRVDLFI